MTKIKMDEDVAEKNWRTTKMMTSKEETKGRGNCGGYLCILSSHAPHLKYADFLVVRTTFLFFLPEFYKGE